MKHRLPLRAALLATLVVPSLAFAHPGHGADAGFATGFSHPFEASDHVFALVAVGLLAARLGRRAAFQLAGVVLALLALGLGVGFTGVALPDVGAWTVIVIALCAVLALAPPRRFAGVIVLLAAAVAFVSGIAHGEWIIPGDTGWGFAGGFLAASAALMGAGFAAGLGFERLRAARVRPDR